MREDRKECCGTCFYSTNTNKKNYVICNFKSENFRWFGGKEKGDIYCCVYYRRETPLIKLNRRMNDYDEC